MITGPPVVSEYDLARFECWMHADRNMNPNHAWNTRLSVRKLIRAGCTSREQVASTFPSVTSQRKSSLRNAFSLFLEFLGTDEL